MTLDLRDPAIIKRIFNAASPKNFDYKEAYYLANSQKHLTSRSLFAFWLFYLFRLMALTFIPIYLKVGKSQMQLLLYSFIRKMTKLSLFVQIGLSRLTPRSRKMRSLLLANLASLNKLRPTLNKGVYTFKGYLARVGFFIYFFFFPSFLSSPNAI